VIPEEWELRPPLTTVRIANGQVEPKTEPFKSMILVAPDHIETATWNWVRFMSTPSGQPGINGNEFAQLPLPIPPLPEQAAIAAVLADMDDELAALEARVAKTRALKQGMMQELLTGRTRLV
jgi:hypothetical protein